MQLSQLHSTLRSRSTDTRITESGGRPVSSVARKTVQHSTDSFPSYAEPRLPAAPTGGSVFWRGRACLRARVVAYTSPSCRLGVCPVVAQSLAVLVVSVGTRLSSPFFLPPSDHGARPRRPGAQSGGRPEPERNYGAVSWSCGLRKTGAGEVRLQCHCQGHDEGNARLYGGGQHEGSGRVGGSCRWT